MGAVVLDEGQELIPGALFGQDLEDIGEAWVERRACVGGQASEEGGWPMTQGQGLFPAWIWCLTAHHSGNLLAVLVQTRTSFPHIRSCLCSLQPRGTLQDRKAKTHSPTWW